METPAKKQRGRPRKATPVVIKPIASPYRISVDIGGQVYEGNGDTMLEALGMLPVPKKIMNKTIVKLTSGDKVKELVMTPLRAKRIFYFYAQPFLAKHFELILK